MQTVQKFIVPLMAIAFCSLFLLGCSSDDKETTVQETSTEAGIEQVEQDTSRPLDQHAEEAGQPSGEGVESTSEKTMETAAEQEETTSDVTVETTETETEEERRPARPRRALEGC